jgi:hypothetical protein
MSATAIGDEIAPEATMKAVILYDDFGLAAKANAMLERAAHRADETTQWNVKPWRENLLAQSGPGDAALTEAADAHLIVLAVRNQADLSPGLLDWLRKWAGRRQVYDAALAVFDGENGGTLSAPLTRELWQFAERHGLSFLFDDSVRAEDEPAFVVRSLRERAVAQTPTLLHILEQPVHEDCRHWGINE